MSCWKESIVPLSQTSFVSLLRHIVHFGVREVVFSRTAPILNQASQSEFARIDIVLSGKKHMRYPASRKIMDAYLEPGSMHYSPPMTAKLPLWDSPHEMSSIVFSKTHLRVTYINLEEPTIQRDICTPYFYHTASPAGNTAKQLCNLLNHCAEHPSSHGIEIPLMDALLRQVLEEVENDSSKHVTKKDYTWLLAHAYVHDNFTSPINRAHVAAALNLSPGYLSMLFQEHCGESFISYLRRLRLEYAGKLLAEKQYSIEEITTQCGYLSSTFFIAAFKKQYGISPGHFRLLKQAGQSNQPGGEKPTQ